MTLGLLLDTDHAFSILTMGPPADSPEAKEFRSFWGERSELRRFQDGSINEAVMWDGSGQEGVANRRTVCHQIIQYLLHRSDIVHIIIVFLIVVAELCLCSGFCKH